METIVKVEAWRWNTTTKEQWELLSDYFDKKFDNSVLDTSFLSSGIYSCSYSSAYLNILIDAEIREKLKGSDITLNFYYLKVDPDDTLEL